MATKKTAVLMLAIIVKVFGDDTTEEHFASIASEGLKNRKIQVMCSDWLLALLSTNGII